jgi:hypothetical protein
MVLSNMLPNQNNGTFTLYAYAYDFAGLSTLLGTRRIAGANAASRCRSGRSTTPGQGQTVSGTIIAWWALAPRRADHSDQRAHYRRAVDGVMLDARSTSSSVPTSRRCFPACKTAAELSAISSSTQHSSPTACMRLLGDRDDAGNGAGVSDRFFRVRTPDGGGWGWELVKRFRTEPRTRDTGHHSHAYLAGGCSGSARWDQSPRPRAAGAGPPTGPSQPLQVSGPEMKARSPGHVARRPKTWRTSTRRDTGYLEWQLNPAAIDDSPCDLQLAPFTTLGLPTQPLYTLDSSVVMREVIEATILRAICSRRRLYERMVEFWNDTSAPTSTRWASSRRPTIATSFGGTRWAGLPTCSTRARTARRCSCI